MKSHSGTYIAINGNTLTNFINLTKEQHKIVLSMRNDTSILKWMYGRHIIKLSEHLKFIKKLKNDKSNHYWLVRDSSGNYIGVISINKLHTENKNAYLGIYTNPSIKTKGLGHVLIDCLKYLAFIEFKLHTLKLEVFENNKRAIKFYERNGFIREGLLKEFVYNNKSWINVVIMGITNENS